MMNKLIVLSVLAFALSACVSISDDAKNKIESQTKNMIQEIKEDKANLCQILVNNHGWKPAANNTCSKR